MQSQQSPGNGLAWILYGLIVLSVPVYAYYALQPHPSELPRGPRLNELLGHVSQVARGPHSLGTPEHDHVRDHIVNSLQKLGLAPQVQSATVTWDAGDLTRAADVQNIMVRLPGKDSSAKAVLVATHYDSAALAPGAADAGASVAAVLELARLQAASPGVRAPLILLFTDGEEWGLLGARAFLEQQALLEEIGAVINLDARGSGGSPFVFQMNGSTSRLAAAMNRCSSPALAVSYSSLAYRYTGNRTDFALFREANLPGFDVAFFDDPVTYHNARDTAARLPSATLLQQANTLYTLAGCIAETGPASLLSGPSAVYASVPGLGVLVYPRGWAIPFAIAILTLATSLAALRRIGGSGWRSIIAAGAILVTLVAAAGLAWGFNLLALSRINPKLVEWQAGDALLAAAAITALASALWGICLLAARFSRKELLAGMAIVLALLNAAVSFWSPEASFLTLIAAISSLMALLVDRTGILEGDMLEAAANAVAWAPAIFFWTQLGILLTVALGARAQAPILFTCVLVALWMLLYPSAQATRVRRFAPAVFGAAVLYLVYARFTARFDDHRPRPDSLILAADLSAGQALWSTFDDQVDEWNQQYLVRPEKRNLGEFFGGAQLELLASPAEPLKLAGPRLELISHTKNTLRLLLKPETGTSALRCDIYADVPIQGIAVQGRSVNVPRRRDQDVSKAAFTLAYLNPPPAGAILELRLAESAPVSLSLMDMRYGFPGGASMHTVPRPTHIIAEPDYLTDCTFLRRVFHFDAADNPIEREVSDVASNRR